MRAKISLFLMGLTVASYACAEPSRDEGRDETTSAVAPALTSERLRASGAASALGVEAYDVTRLGAGASVALLSADGTRLGTLEVSGVEARAPRFDLSWGGAAYAFVVDLTRPEAPLTVCVGGETCAVVKSASPGAMEDRERAALRRVGNQWALVRAAFTDTGLDADSLAYVNRTHFGGRGVDEAKADPAASVTSDLCPDSQCRQGECLWFWPRKLDWIHVPLTDICAGADHCNC